MAKSHYSSKKRRKELDRKFKQEQKRQRRMNKNADDSDSQENQDQQPDNVESLQDESIIEKG